MKRKIIFLGIFLLMVAGVFALTQPRKLDQPLLPGTGQEITCEDWDIKDKSCNGDVRHYMQCQPTMGGGVWVPQSENCKDYGASVRCLGGECKRAEEITEALFWGVGIIVLLIILFKALKKRR